MKGIGKIWFSVVLVLLCACRTTKEECNMSDAHIRTNSAWHVVRDSIFIHDSIYVHEKSDTVFLTKYRTLYKENLVRDTLFVCDTLYKERVITEYVSSERGRFHWWWLLLLLPLLIPGLLKRLLKLFWNA